jgi:hypothetical protein
VLTEQKSSTPNLMEIGSAVLEFISWSASYQTNGSYYIKHMTITEITVDAIM